MGFAGPQAPPAVPEVQNGQLAAGVARTKKKARKSAFYLLTRKKWSGLKWGEVD
jgi:hypothetical protein